MSFRFEEIFLWLWQMSENMELGMVQALKDSGVLGFEDKLYLYEWSENEELGKAQKDPDPF